MQIRELMSPTVVSITPEESVALAARLLTRHNLGALPVCTYEGELVGIVTDRDIVTRCIAADQDPSRVSVRDIMTRELTVASPAEDAKQAAKRMAKAQIRRLPVVEQGRICGMVSLGDLANHRESAKGAADALLGISNNVSVRD